MRRPPRVLIGVLLAVIVSGGGATALSRLHHAADPWRVNGSGINVHAGTLLDAVQAPAVLPPRASPKSKPTPTAAAKPTPSPKPTKSPSAKPTHTAPPAGSSVVNQLLAQINALRAGHGLPPYTLLSGLNASAHKHNLMMMGTCGMSHQCPGEPSLGSRISAQGVHWSACGENIGWSGPHPNTTSALISAAEGLTTAMYNETPPDDGHRLNLLSSQFHHIGIDVVRDSSGKVWLTQDFSN
jgi:uncharacterized protein YkwD